MELFAIVYKDTLEILTPKSFKKYWPNYGGSYLQGWRPPKKIYYSLGFARSGFSHIPNELKDKLAIAKVSKMEIVQDGESLHKNQEEKRLKKELEWKEKRRLYDLECAKANLERAQKALQDLQ